MFTAFRFLEKKAIEAKSLRRSVRAATLERCARTGARTVIVKSHGRGLHVMTALALTPDGVPLGLCEQRWWTRNVKHEKRHELRPFHTRETINWIHVLCGNKLTVRAQPISIKLRVARRKDDFVTLNAVHVSEVLDEKLRVSDPLDWKLLTTASIASFSDVRRVVDTRSTR